jgi:hypothetical protein
MGRVEIPAMDAVIREKQGAEAAALQDLRQRTQDYLSRALYDLAEPTRREFWRRAGRSAPQPEMRVDDMDARARRTGDGVGAGIRAVREADPDHLIWLNHAPRNTMTLLRHYNREADMVGCDIYPIPYNLWVSHSDLMNMRPSSVGEYTDRMRQAAPGKACAMVLQGCGWRDLEGERKRSDELHRFGFGRRPTFAETRFMAYNALMHGAHAVLYWGTAYAHEEVPEALTATAASPARESQLWTDIMAVAKELRALESAWLAPETGGLRVKVHEMYGSIDSGGVRASLRRVGDDWVLFVANENTHGVTSTVRGLPAALNGRTLYRLGTQETQTVKAGALMDGVAAFDVHVYATSRRFEPSATIRR